MAFYLKYRPQTVSQLDLAIVREKLTRILLAKTLPHAYLFCGPKGLGKTSSARIFTKSINCLQRKDGQVDPCNKCDHCLAVNEGRAIDLVEIDAASNRGIDDIRQLKEQIKLSPTQFKYKSYVIDEVHMLTTEAFNALLKTLEEPPRHVIFILCTTNPEKIPATILSRVMKVVFVQPQPAEIKRSLQRAIEGEKLSVSDKALARMVKQADYSFRDAHKLLEQLSFQGKKISADMVDTLMGGSVEADLVDFWEALLKLEQKLALSWLWSKRDQGVDPLYLNEQILAELRKILLANFDLSKVKKYFDLNQTKILIKLFTDAYLIVKNSPYPYLALEMVVLDYINSLAKSSPTNDQAAIKSQKKNNQKTAVKDNSSQNHQQNQPGSLAGPDLLNQIKKNWYNLLAKLQPQNHSLSALLRSAQPKTIEGDRLIIEVYYQFHKSKLESDKLYQMVAQAIEELWGAKVRIGYVLGHKNMKKTKKIVSATEEDLIKTAKEVFAGGGD